MRFTSWLIALLLLTGCVEKKTTKTNEYSGKPTQIAVHKAPVKAEKNPEGFTPVKEMLSRACAPCHNPGGKMYSTLPFDNAEIVRSHCDSIKGRLDKPEDKLVLEQWLSEPQL